MKTIVVYATIIFALSVCAIGQSVHSLSAKTDIIKDQQLRLHLGDKAMLKAIAAVAKPWSSHVTAADSGDACSTCVGNGWLQCGLNCNGTCTMDQLTACQDQVLVLCAVLGACQPLGE